MRKVASPRADLYRAERAKGKTYREIAEMCGVSYQAVSQACGEYSPEYSQVITKKGCIYPNLRKWMNDNKVSRRELLRRMGRVPVTGNHDWLSRCMRGMSDIKKSDIDRLIAVTGLSYEVLFATDPQEGVEEDG